MNKRTNSNRVRDFVLYLVIGIALLALIFAIAAFGVNGDLFVEWFSLAVFTLLLFGYFIAGSRPLWKRSKFWVVSCLCFLLHLIGFLALIHVVAFVKPIWFGMIGVIEMATLLCLRRLQSTRSLVASPQIMHRKLPRRVLINSTIPALGNL